MTIHTSSIRPFVPELQPRDGEVVILKPSYGAFFDMPVVASDATATSLPKMHQAELCILRRSFARVLTVEAILSELAR